jgi:hypothetical protein
VQLTINWQPLNPQSTGLNKQQEYISLSEIAIRFWSNNQASAVKQQSRNHEDPKINNSYSFDNLIELQ